MHKFVTEFETKREAEEHLTEFLEAECTGRAYGYSFWKSEDKRYYLVKQRLWCIHDNTSSGRSFKG